jgi:hypothetical protein
MRRKRLNDIAYNNITDSGGFGIRVGDGASKNLDSCVASVH